MSMQDLSEAAKSLSGSDKQFASSLLEQWSSRGSVSEKQMYWVKVLIARSRAPKLGPAGLVRISQLFQAAKDRGLKGPKVSVAEGVVLSLAKAHSANPGAIYIKGGRQYGDVYYGMIDANGSLVPSRNMVPAVQEALIAWSDNPAKAAKAYGHQSGCCAFCSKELNDPRSVAMGYGPICAEKYGLPWGEEKVSGEMIVEA